MIDKETWLKALEERHGKEMQEKFNKATVAVCGLGGLGSNISIALARAGIGTLLLIDYDKVDLSNLHRQQYKPCQIGMQKTCAMKENLMEIAPYVNVEIKNAKITESNCIELLKHADVICEAFDDAESKAMILDKIVEKMPEKFLITASGMAGMGNPNHIKTRKISEHVYICGDGVSDVETTIGLVSSRVMICASHQAHTALMIIAGEKI